MQEEQRLAAKGQMIALMQAGHPWHEAVAMTGVQIGRKASFQLLRNVRLRGDAAVRLRRMTFLIIMSQCLCTPWISIPITEKPHGDPLEEVYHMPL